MPIVSHEVFVIIFGYRTLCIFTSVFAAVTSLGPLAQIFKKQKAAGSLRPFIHHPVASLPPDDDYFHTSSVDLLLVQRFLSFTPPRFPTCLTRNQVFKMLPVNMGGRDVIAEPTLQLLQQSDTRRFF